MLTPLKQHKELEKRYHQGDNALKFQEFQETGHRNARLEELMSFARIVSLRISTVVVSLFLPILDLVPIWAFLFASLVSLAITSAVSSIIWSLRH